MLNFRPSRNYFLATRSLAPLSTRFGFDRGTPIDRYWIEKFLQANKHYVHGRVLEVTDSAYTRRFGGSKVTHSDVLDINPQNKKANIIDDLRSLKSVKSNTYDCVILTQVLGMIDDIYSAIRQIHRVLKPRGTVLVTSASISPTWREDDNFWRFTPAGLHYAFSKYFPKSNLSVSSYGNVLAGQCFWVGMARQELSPEELDYNDPHFPCVVTLIATK